MSHSQGMGKLGVGGKQKSELRLKDLLKLEIEGLQLQIQALNKGDIRKVCCCVVFIIKHYMLERRETTTNLFYITLGLTKTSNQWMKSGKVSNNLILIRYNRYRTLFPYKPDPMPSFFRHTLRSRIQNLNLFWGPQKFLGASEAGKKK